MFTIRGNNNNEGKPSSDIRRRYGRPRSRFISALLVLATICCLLIIGPFQASADSTSADNQEAMATPENAVQATQASAAPDTSAPAPSAPDSPEQAATAAEASPDDTKAFVYNSNVPLDSDIQQYLYDLCTQRSLDYKMCLAIIKHESNFNAKALGGGSNYGLFQINKCHNKTLSAALKTEIKPFDPKTNINWGTYLLSCLYAEYSTSYKGEDLLKAVLSAYNKGAGGFAKYGFAQSYIKGYYKALDVVNTWFA